MRLVRLLARPPRPAPADDHRRVLVKSVQCMLSLEWIYRRWRPIVVAIHRHPVNVVASWLELGWDELGAIAPRVIEERCARWGVAPPDPNRTEHPERIAWRVGFLARALEDAERACIGYDPSRYLSVAHEDLCADPWNRIREILEFLGLPWAGEVEEFLRDSNRPGYSYDTHRVWAEQPYRWRSLAPDVLDRVKETLRPFPLRYDVASLNSTRAAP
jgi:hypothetical protein